MAIFIACNENISFVTSAKQEWKFELKIFMVFTSEVYIFLYFIVFLDFIID